MIVERIRWTRVNDPRIPALDEGALCRALVKGDALCFVRLHGTLHALRDVCPHQGKPLSGGWCEDGHVVCPWHRIQFEPRTGRSRHGMCSNVEVFPLEERADGVYIGIPYVGLRLFGVDLW